MLKNINLENLEKIIEHNLVNSIFVTEPKTLEDINLNEKIKEIYGISYINASKIKSPILLHNALTEGNYPAYKKEEEGSGLQNSFHNVIKSVAEKLDLNVIEMKMDMFGRCLNDDVNKFIERANKNYTNNVKDNNLILVKIDTSSADDVITYSGIPSSLSSQTPALAMLEKAKGSIVLFENISHSFKIKHVDIMKLMETDQFFQPYANPTQLKSPVIGFTGDVDINTVPQPIISRSLVFTTIEKPVVNNMKKIR